MDPNELIRSLSSTQEGQTAGSELDDSTVDQLLKTLLVEEDQQPATRAIDLGALLAEGTEGAGAEAASRLDLSQLLGQPDLKEILTRLLVEKFKLPEVMAATLAEAIMKNISTRKPARRKTSTARKRKTTKQTKPKLKTTSQKKPKRKTSRSTAAKKKKTSKSTAKKKKTTSSRRLKQLPQHFQRD